MPIGSAPIRSWSIETSALDAGLPEGATPRHTTLDSSGLRERYGLQVPDITAIIEPMIAARRNDLALADVDQHAAGVAAAHHVERLVDLDRAGTRG